MNGCWLTSGQFFKNKGNLRDLSNGINGGKCIEKTK
jgi:hypothetical protein